MTEKRIRKLSEYISYVEDLNESFFLSRGQSKDYDLLPSALRKDENDKRLYTRQKIDYLLNEFQLSSYHFIENPWDINNEYEWMVHAQHYGLPTRMLDFSTSHIVSLMFAVEKAFEEEASGDGPTDGVVWFIDPLKLNLLHGSQKELFSISDNNLVNNSKLDKCRGPVATQGRKSNIRLRAQHGVFIYFQDSEENLFESILENAHEDSENADEIIKKIIIDGKSKKDILVALFSSGVGFTQIYPELSSVSKDILLMEKISEYKRQREELTEDE